MRHPARIVAAIAAAGTLLVGLATPAHAAEVVDGTFYDAVYHYGSWTNGSAWIEGGTNVLETDAAGGASGASGYGLIEKGHKALRVQVDYVRLGNATQGGVLAENLTPKNSGLAGGSAQWETPRWSTIRAAGSPACTSAPFMLWTRVGYSVRWSDGTLSRWSVLGPRSARDYCLA